MKFNNSKQIIKKLHKDLSNTDTVLVLGHFPHLNYEILEKFLSHNIPYVSTWKERIIKNDKYYGGLLGSLGNHSAIHLCHKAKNLLIIGDISVKLANNIYHDAFSIDYLSGKNIYSIVLDKSRAYKKSKKIFYTTDINYILKNLKINIPDSFLKSVEQSISNLLYVIAPKSELEKYCYVSSLIYNNNKLDIPVITGVGNHWYAIGKYFRFNNPNNWISSTEWGTIGCGYFYGIGAYLALKKPVWIIEGDGGTAFSGTSLLYLINNKHLPITIIIFNDNYYSAIYASFYNLNKGKPLSKIDKIVSTPPILNKKILPNCHEFYDTEEFYRYLNKNPISNEVRFIIVHINKNKLMDTNNSLVYGIDIHNKDYINLLKNDDFLKLKNHMLVHKLDVF